MQRIEEIAAATAERIFRAAEAERALLKESVKHEVMTGLCEAVMLRREHSESSAQYMVLFRGMMSKNEAITADTIAHYARPWIKTVAPWDCILKIEIMEI